MTQDTLFDAPPIQAAGPKPRRTVVHPYHWTDAAGWRATAQHRCPHCRAHILTGLDQDQCAIQATATATPLTPLGEALHQLADIPTYTLTRHSNRGTKLTRRRAENIAQQPAGSPRIDVLPAHRCNPPPMPPEAFTAPTVAPPASLTAPRNSPPPF
ncbi:hypothetical protein EII34_14985 [Arachnia propionica]|uniref:Uncharacterized protein n=1 Tax=Arachnia propionica TaxID=1750 RepID=A0A3P1T1G0_9ACTN|nr:hypothetical protein [Arachnia propionica]RRD03209.1 hypothetical protein EII34_14985 [Arachnia propionica]